MNSQAFSEWLTVVLYIGENHGNSADFRKANILHEGTFSTLARLYRPRSILRVLPTPPHLPSPLFMRVSAFSTLSELYADLYDL